MRRKVDGGTEKGGVMTVMVKDLVDIEETAITREETRTRLGLRGSVVGREDAGTSYLRVEWADGHVTELSAAWIASHVRGLVQPHARKLRTVAPSVTARSYPSSGTEGVSTSSGYSNYSNL